jgi:small Trp-rich protein
MYLLGLGIFLMLLKYLAIGPVADLSWWWVLSPFALAVVWWAWADASGYTKRKAMEIEEKRVAERRQRTKDALNSSTQKRRR